MTFSPTLDLVLGSTSVTTSPSSVLVLVLGLAGVGGLLMLVGRAEYEQEWSGHATVIGFALVFAAFAIGCATLGALGF